MLTALLLHSEHAGKDRPIAGNPDADSGTGKVIDAHHRLHAQRGGKVVGSAHRVVLRVCGASVRSSAVALCGSSFEIRIKLHG
jgi:hypothetical protein